MRTEDVRLLLKLRRRKLLKIDVWRCVLRASDGLVHKKEDHLVRSLYEENFSFVANLK